MPKYIENKHGRVVEVSEEDHKRLIEKPEYRAAKKPATTKKKVEPKKPASKSTPPDAGAKTGDDKTGDDPKK